MRRLIPLVAALALAACAAAFPSAPPVGKLAAVQTADVDTWINALRPAIHTTLRFGWILNRDEAKGRGGAGIAPLDSLYFFYAGPLGSHSGSAFVLGDSEIWAEPKDEVEKLVPSYDLLWGLVGVPRPPRSGWKVDGSRDAVRTTWRYTRGADTTLYVLWKPDGVLSLLTQVTMDGQRIGTATTLFDAGRHPVKARLDAQISPARLDLTFDNPSKPLPFDRDMWLAPRP